MKLTHCAGYLALAIVLAACGTRETILEGERLNLRGDALGEEAVETGDEAAEQPATAQPISLAQPVAHAEWTHRNGTPSHRIVHPALATGLARAWSTDIGAGDDRKHRITADPVVAGGRVFAMDSQSRVSAVSTDGAKLWSVSVAPGFDREKDASGGGLAVAGDTLYVTTGFGTLTALDVETGAERWTQRMDAAATGAPTVLGDLVYAVSRDGSAWAVETANGRVAWILPGVPTQSVMVGGAGPAVTEQIAVFPFGSGDMVASFPRGGVRLWAASLAGQRRGRVYAGVTDITGDPVIDGDVVYGGTSSGRLAAFDLRSGERIWTAREGAMSPVWPAGGSVFAVTDDARLLRIDAGTGEEVWAVELPYFKNRRPRRREGVHVHHGPVLAGGRLIVASSDGTIRAYDPVDGALVEETALPGGATTGVAVAGGTLYVVTSRGQLQAFR